MRILFFLLLIPFFSFSQKKELPIPVPSGTVKISGNFYVDKMEIANIDYREYLYWLKRFLGNIPTVIKMHCPAKRFSKKPI